MRVAEAPRPMRSSPRQCRPRMLNRSLPAAPPSPAGQHHLRGLPGGRGHRWRARGPGLPARLQRAERRRRGRHHRRGSRQRRGCLRRRHVRQEQLQPLPPGERQQQQPECPAHDRRRLRLSDPTMLTAHGRCEHVQRGTPEQASRARFWVQRLGSSQLLCGPISVP